jgi:hypothetical protein
VFFLGCSRLLLFGVDIMVGTVSRQWREAIAVGSVLSTTGVITIEALN